MPLNFPSHTHTHAHIQLTVSEIYRWLYLNILSMMDTHQFLLGFGQLPRILWSWAEDDTSVWVSLCSQPPACWSGASVVSSVCLHSKAKTSPRKIRLFITSIITNPKLISEVSRNCCHFQSNWFLQEAETYPVVFWVIPQVLKTLNHCLSVLLPLPLAENYLQEVPHPANNRYITQLLFG